MPFNKLGLHPNILKGIREIGFEKPTPVQEQAIPPILNGQDVIATAQTGTGKTAAFMLPILHRLLMVPRHKRGVRALVLSPTRELALQSTDHLKKLSRYVPLRGEAIFGGVSMQPQINALKQGLDIISATPGRLLDHVYEGRIDFGTLEIFVLDEADRMMDMGFMPDVQRIISLLPPKRQNLIFSATISDDIMKLSNKICKDPAIIRVGGSGSRPPSKIRQLLYPVAREQKTELLLRLLSDGQHMSSVIIFTRTKIGADRLAHTLQRNNLRTSIIHGDKSQNQRLHALQHFKQGKSQVLVATDVAARGIDIQDISHVVNFDVPHNPEDYVHRIGRTGRVEAEGDALTLVAPDEEELVTAIEKEVHQKINRVVLPDFNYKVSVHRAGAFRPGGGGGHRGPHRSFRGHSGSSHGRPSHGGGQHRSSHGAPSHSGATSHSGGQHRSSQGGSSHGGGQHRSGGHHGKRY